jgi:hypothetical protein
MCLEIFDKVLKMKYEKNKWQILRKLLTNSVL